MSSIKAVLPCYCAVARDKYNSRNVNGVFHCSITMDSFIRQEKDNSDSNLKHFAIQEMDVV